ncbi:Amino acid/polyamine transporter I [Acididesulfobacillus acetoxydans]|uniref:Amino acid/polyamine transporter I n=1 Tax=Acididesulfobacillus acetoxydans TaxID=1561005 RepID=A0A8S0X2T0_9FIRM|nr:amino acid permease [Acididesulfobacillus acetoxydans]CAA7599470.1 Amino acid/polyamine transporter I [Acididesulfobacillus acetoxydans]CEJ06725.1 Cationic amino acid transporter 4, vacuolar [Acididesulfobacillus acetoxydans]
MNLLRTKSVQQLVSESEEQQTKLKRALSAFDLTALGIGGIIGTGIFVLTGIGASNFAGPALVISFIIAGLASGLAALSYAEFAAMIPVAGSAYTYGYAALGEIFAWVIGWDLLLEYGLASSTVAVGWSGYLVNLLSAIGVNLPAWATNAPGAGGIIDLPAILIVGLIVSLLTVGVKESKWVNNIIVVVKLAVILLFIAVGTSHVTPANWHPYMPFGWGGVMTGASIIFFAYLGFDAVSTAAEEAKKPQRDLPIGLMASLGISTVLYILVTMILTGMVNYTKLNTSAPVSFALNYIGMHWAAALLSVGAIAGITSVLLVDLFAQTRILYAMSRDGLLPPVFSSVHQKFKTPHVSTRLVGLVVAAMAGFTPIKDLAEMANIGTLFAFVIVSAAVIVLRKTKPEQRRPFRVPLVPWLPLLAIVACLYLMYSLPLLTWIRFVVWLAVGLIIYWRYGSRHSLLQKGENGRLSGDKTMGTDPQKGGRGAAR